MMVGSCPCLKENLDELRTEKVCYERVTGYPEVIHMLGKRAYRKLALIVRLRDLSGGRRIDQTERPRAKPSLYDAASVFWRRIE